ncbi:putative OSBP family protein [Lyophyllum shimeji]|uniref:OSBP family protein n=1 Tax=Lyophyllum shimeji TaxID=47721 RepID=A0A9P3UR31_LYOSH|nr:putative OSBP family protein [Lyophyllum shimeji]
MSEAVGEAVPAAQRGSWSSFLKSIASFGGDLSSLTAPPFILSPVSLTEFPAYCPPSRRPQMVHLHLKDQYTSRNQSMGSEKKPLNPVLGELFYGTWPAPASNPAQGTTTLLVEQVSHHPPITAYVHREQDQGLRLTGHNAQKTSFSAGSIIVKQIGHAILTVTPSSGSAQPIEYLLTLPRLRIDGLWYGSPTSSSPRHPTSSAATLSPPSSTKAKATSPASPLLQGHRPPHPHRPRVPHARRAPHRGTWHERSKFTRTTGGPAKEHVLEGKTRGKHGVEEDWFHDVSEDGKVEVTAVGGEPNGEMGDFETRRLWALVAKGIREGDFETASREKSRIENEQRQRRRDEAAAGTTWPLKHFTHAENDPVYERLARLIKLIPPTEDHYLFRENWPQGLAAKN